MISVTIASLGSPPSFIIPADDPLYWLLRLCYEESLDRYNLSEAGAEIRQVEESDVASLQTDIGSALTDGLSDIDALYTT